MNMIGQSVDRVEDDDLLQASTRFVGSLAFENMLHMHVVRSPYAHARLKSVIVGKAASAPGVVAVWTGNDIRELPPIGFRRIPDRDLLQHRQPVMASDELRYVGEPVAIVLATDPCLAEDAGRLVAIDAEIRPPVLDCGPETDTRTETRMRGGNEVARIEKGYGDVEAAFAAAEHKISISCRLARQTAVPMETRGAIAVPHPGAAGFDLYGAAKVPHANRQELARMLSLDIGGVVLREGHAGGGFGVRGELYPEDVLVAFAALRLRRPVKWIEDRSEHFLAINHSRDQTIHLDAAVSKTGVIAALRARIATDQGAYLRTHEIKVSDLSCAFLPGPYRIPAYQATATVHLTNKTPCGTYRAPGRFEATFAMERMIDAIAKALELDPVEVRRRNLISATEMPFDRQIEATGKRVVYDSGDYLQTLDTAIRAFDLPELRRTAEERRQRGECIGVGLAMFVEKTDTALHETARLELASDGKIEIVTGTSSLGQGMETALAQIAADGLGFPIDVFRIVRGQTDRISQSGGTFASRTTVMAGSAVHEACRIFRQKLIETCAALLDETTDRATLHREGCRINGRNVGLSELRAMIDASAPSTQLVAEADFSSGAMACPYGVHIAQVKVDPDDLSITVEKYHIAYEIGRAVNPDLVKAQLLGGAVQGIGGALMEEISFSSDGQPLTTSFADYVTPRIVDVPAFEILLLEDWPSPTNPLGLKGAGEGGINAAGAAVAAAVEDAFAAKIAPRQLPITPRALFDLLSKTDDRLTSPLLRR
ncbi:xanthine dehydrogenase family protein molybdopterin-binding subunit [Neorhizobium sp. IRAMC:178]|uniref:xanthine dehydrogenase family protein molybdopterin-binding subunit n=1 Tax=Neorhizobium tunisiense TaxID=3144793 RepID=UPI0031F7183A